MSRGRGGSEALFRACLRVYPRAFRERFAAGMLETFRDRDEEVRGRGRGARLRFLALTCADLVLSGLRERFSPALRSGPVHRADAVRSSRRGAPVLDAVRQDLRFAFRSLRRRPGFAAAAIVTLALGVGANSAIFSVVNGVLLRPLPWRDPDALVTVWAGDRGSAAADGYMSAPDIEDLAEAGIFDALVGHAGGVVALTGLGEAEVVAGARATRGILGTFGLAPVLGRDLTPEDAFEGAAPVVVLGHGFWMEKMGGDPGVVGRTLELQGTLHEVVGVAPAGFDFPGGARLWRPYPLNPEGCGRGCHVFRVVGRLAGGVGLESARQRADALAARLSVEFPESNHEKGFHLRTLEETIVGDVRAGLWMLLGAVGLVLIIACANVASLLLVRAQSRAGEVAVRAALGAGRRRLAAQLLMESLVLAVAGGALGLALAVGGVEALRRVSPGTVPRIDEVAVDGTVVLFTLGLVWLVTLLFGLGPALHLARAAPARELSRGRRGGGESRALGRSRGLLLASEVALSLVLLVGAGLLLRSFATIHALDPGYQTRDVARFTLSLPASRYADLDAVAGLFRGLEDRLRAVPGVASVGSAYGAPLSSSNITGEVRVDGRPEPQRGAETYATIRAVTHGYLETMRIPVLRGRGIQSSDGSADLPVALVNEAFVRENFPGEDPIGRRVEVTAGFGYVPRPTWTIVGVVPDVRSRGLTSDAIPEVYVSQPQFGPGLMTVVMRGEPGAPSFLPRAREVVRELDPDLPLRDAETMTEVVARQAAPARFYLLLLGLFAALAVVLAAVGLYGVIGYLVSRRTREIGIRMALGARRGEVTSLVLAQAARPVAVGLAAGLGGAWASGRLLEGLLYGVEPTDPATFLGVSALLLGVSTAATLLPARRAARVDPSEALREE